MPSKPAPNGNAAIVRSLRTAGVRSFSKAVNAGLADYHRTAGGRVVVLKFASKAGRPLKSVYLDQIGDTFGTVVRPTRSVFGGGMSARRATGRTARTAAKKVVKKAATKGTPRQSVRVVAKKVGERSAGGEIAAGKASAGIPAPIREFAIVFLVNIRKIVCPTGKKKPALSAATTGTVGSLAIWLVSHFGITTAVAETFASALLITVTTATKGTFCDMTAEMVKVALKKA